MKMYVKLKKSILYILMLCLAFLAVSSAFPTAVFGSEKAYAVSRNTLTGNMIEANINDAKLQYTARSLYDKIRQSTGSIPTDSTVSFDNIDGTALPYHVIDEIVMKLEFINDAGESKLVIVPRIVGNADFTIGIKITSATSQVTREVYSVPVTIEARFPRVFPSGEAEAGEQIPKNQMIECRMPVTTAYYLKRGIKTTIDFLSEPEQTKDIESIISVKKVLETRFGIKSLVGATIVSISPNDNELSMLLDETKNGSDGKNMNVEAFYTGSKKTIEVPVSIMFRGGTDTLGIKFVFAVETSTMSSTISPKSIEKITQTIYGTTPREILFSTLYDDLVSSFLYLPDSSTPKFTGNIVNYERIKDENGKTIGLKLIPIENGYTAVKFTLMHRRADGTESPEREFSLPVNVTGYYNRITRETFSNKEVTLSAFDVGTAGEKGYIFDSIAESGDSNIVNVSVQSGKLVVKPGAAGATTIKVFMYNPLVGKQVKDELSGNMADARIVVELGLTVKPYSFFDSLTDTGWIILGVSGGILAVIVLYLIISTIVKVALGGKKRREFEKESAKKLAAKKEIEDRKRAQQMAMMRAMTPPHMQPQAQALALGAGVGPQGGSQMLAIGGTISTPVKTKQTLMLLTDGAPQENTEQIQAEKMATDAGANKAVDFIKEAEEKARRAAEEAKLAKQKQKDDVKQQKIDAEKKRRAMEVAAKEAPPIIAAIVEMLKESNECRKTLFAKNYDVKMFEESKKEVTAKLPTVTTETEIVACKERLEDVSGKLSQARGEIAAREQEQKDRNNALGANQKTLIDLVTGYDELDAKFDEYTKNRAKLQKDLDDDFDKFKLSYTEEANNKRMLENVERMQEEMRHQQECKKQEELRHHIETKIGLLTTIITDCTSVENVDGLTKLDGRLGGVETSLVDSEKVPELLTKLAETKNLLLAKRSEIENIEKLKQAEQGRLLKEKSQEVINLNAKLLDAYKMQIETDKQLFVLESSKTKLQNQLKRYSSELSTASTEAESAKLSELLEETNVKMSKVKGEIFQIEGGLDVKSEESAASQEKMLAVIKEFNLADLKKEIEHKNEIAQRDLQADYDRFVADYKDEMSRREQLEEAERQRKTLREREENIKRQAQEGVVKAQSKSLKHLVQSVKLATELKQLSAFSEDLRSIRSELSGIQAPPEVKELIVECERSIKDRHKEIEGMNDNQLAKAKDDEVKQNRINEMAARVRSKALKIKALIPDIKSKEVADKLVVKIEEIMESIPRDLQIDEVIAPLKKCKVAVKHAGEIAEVKNRRPKKKTVKTIIKGSPTGVKKSSSGAKSSSGSSKSSGVKNSSGGAKKPSAGGKKPIKKK